MLSIDLLRRAERQANTTAPPLKSSQHPAAIIKIGRHFAKVRSVLDGLGLTGSAGYVERATLGAQHVSPLSEAPDEAPYFSMILIYKGDDPWLT